MKFDPKMHNRRSIRIKGYDYAQVGGYYVTIVTLWRDCLFGEVVDGGMRVNALGRITQECWDEIPVHFPNVHVDTIVVMPNHVHGIVFIRENKGSHLEAYIGVQVGVQVGAQHAAPLRGMTRNVKPGSLGAIIRSFKSAVTRRVGRELNSANIWQRNYYEHIIRDQAEYERIASYIIANPVNWNDDEENPNKYT